MPKQAMRWMAVAGSEERYRMIGLGGRCCPGLIVATTLICVGLVVAGCGGAGKATRGTPGTRTHEVALQRNVPAGNSEASKRCRDLWPLIRRAAAEARIDPALLVGVVRAESNFRNDVRSSANAIGLTQVLPSTARGKSCGDLSDPYENLLCGGRVLAGFLRYYGEDLLLGLSGYNAGHAMPNQARKKSELPANLDYVESVLWARAIFLSRGCDF